MGNSLSSDLWDCNPKPNCCSLPISRRIKKFKLSFCPAFWALVSHHERGGERATLTTFACVVLGIEVQASQKAGVPLLNCIPMPHNGRVFNIHHFILMFILNICFNIHFYLFKQWKTFDVLLDHTEQRGAQAMRWPILTVNVVTFRVVRETELSVSMRVCPEGFNWREETHPECERPHRTGWVLQLNTSMHLFLLPDHGAVRQYFQHHNWPQTQTVSQNKPPFLVASVSGTAAMRRITNRAVTFTRLALLCPWLL